MAGRPNNAEAVPDIGKHVALSTDSTPPSVEHHAPEAIPHTMEFLLSRRPDVPEVEDATAGPAAGIVPGGTGSSRSSPSPEATAGADTTPPTPGRLGNLFSGLAHPAYRTLLVVYLVTQTGFWMSTVALQWLTGRLTDNDPFLLGLLYFCNLVPLLLVSPLGGIIADRRDRRTVMIAGQVATTVCSGLLVVSLATMGPSLPVLFGFAIAIGTTLALMGPAAIALMANAVPPTALPSAISLQSAVMNIARMVGPTVAGPLLAGLGAWSAFGGYFLTGSIAAVALRWVQVPPRTFEPDSESFLRQVLDGARHVRQRRPAGAALGLTAMTAFLGSSYVPLLTVFAYDVLDGGDSMFTVLFATAGVGALVGTVVTGLRPRPPRIRSVLAALVVQAVAMGVFAWSTSGVLSVAALLVVAAITFASLTGMNVLLQTVIDDRQRGRVMSLYIVAWGGLVPVGSLVLGALADVVGPAAAMSMFAGLLLALSLVGLVIDTIRRRGDRAR